MAADFRTHLQWAAGFEQNIPIIQGTGLLQWTAVATIYSAMHYVQAYLTRNGLTTDDIENHRIRNKAVREVTDIRVFYAEYMQLFKAGWDCRYDGYIPTPALANALVTVNLPRIRDRIRTLLPP